MNTPEETWQRDRDERVLMLGILMAGLTMTRTPPLLGWRFDVNADEGTVGFDSPMSGRRMTAKLTLAPLESLR